MTKKTMGGEPATFIYRGKKTHPRSNTCPAKPNIGSLRIVTNRRICDGLALPACRHSQ